MAHLYTLLHQLKQENIKPHPYAFGTRGPAASDALAQKYGLSVWWGRATYVEDGPARKYAAAKGGHANGQDDDGSEANRHLFPWLQPSSPSPSRPALDSPPTAAACRCPQLPQRFPSGAAAYHHVAVLPLLNQVWALYRAAERHTPSRTPMANACRASRSATSWVCCGQPLSPAGAAMPQPHCRGIAAAEGKRACMLAVTQTARSSILAWDTCERFVFWKPEPAWVVYKRTLVRVARVLLRARGRVTAFPVSAAVIVTIRFCGSRVRKITQYSSSTETMITCQLQARGCAMLASQDLLSPALGLVQTAYALVSSRTRPSSG